MQPDHCLNCHEPLQASQKFCPACGQKTATSRLKLKDVLHDGFHYFLHADKGIIQLVKSLVTENGLVAREFVSGQRKKHFPPLNFFLIVAGIYLFAGTLFHRFEQIESASAMPVQMQKLPPEKQRIARIIAERKTKAVWFITHYANVVAMFAAPFISLVVWAMYRKSGYNYTEHLTANLYLVGFTNLVYSVVLTPTAFLLHGSSTSAAFVVLFPLFEIVYRTIFYYRFINQPERQGWAKTAIKSTLAVLSWLVLNFVAMTVYISLGIFFK